MANPSGYLAPSALQADTFSIVRPAALSAAGERYLEIVTPFNSAPGRVVALQAGPDSATRILRIHTAVRALENATQVFDSALSNYGWPLTVVPLTRGLVREDEAVERWCREGEVVAAKDANEWANSYPEPPTAQLRYPHRVRQALGLPDPE